MGAVVTRTRIHSVPTVVLLVFGAGWVTPATEWWARLVSEKRNGWQGTRSFQGISWCLRPSQGYYSRIETTVGTLWIRVLPAPTTILLPRDQSSLPNNLDSMRRTLSPREAIGEPPS